MFEFKAKIATKDIGEDGQEHDGTREVVLRFKPYEDAPGRISRYNQGNIERQLWLTMEWGLVEPAHWPENSDLPGHLILDEVGQGDITDCYQAWQQATDKDNKDD